MTSPTVGIGLPVYCNAKFLAKTLDSILTQTYPNFVVYLSDDGSNDGTAEICQNYARYDSRIQYSQNKVNLGPFGNHKKVLDCADTDYFMFARGHEILPPNLIQDCLEILEKDKSVVLAYASTKWIDEDDVIIENKHLCYFDTRGCDVVSRCALVFWGKYEYFYGLTRTDIMKSINALEEVVGTDLIMVLEMALVGSFAHINSGVRFRRYHYSNEPYKLRIRRYQQSLTSRVSYIERVFPFINLPWYLYRAIWRGRISISEKILISFITLVSAPLKFIIARGEQL